jgi:hypothetical protein
LKEEEDNYLGMVSKMLKAKENKKDGKNELRSFGGIKVIRDI